MASNLVAYKCQKHTTRPGMDLTLSICTWHMLLMPLLAHLAQSSAWLCFRHVKGCNEDIVLCFFVQFLNSTASWITTNGGAHFCVHQLAHVVPGLGAKGNGTILIANKGVAQDDLARKNGDSCQQPFTLGVGRLPSELFLLLVRPGDARSP